MKTLQIGIIGAGWMGTTHARAYNNIVQHYGTEIIPKLHTIVDAVPEQAERVCRQYGFANWSTDPDAVIKNAEIDIVLITTPNRFHVPLVEQAAAAGKAIFCEKPLGLNGADARRALDAVRAHGSISMVGFIYLHNPMVVYARELIRSGKLGEVVSFHGQYDMEYSADPAIPHSWRQLDEISGALGDIGAHMLALSDFVVGSRIDEVCGKSKTIYKTRPDPARPDSSLPVNNDDLFHAIYTYENGALGNLVTSRVAPGNKVGERFEVQLTRGSIRFDQERMNELEVYDHTDAPSGQGFKLIRAMPEHGEYGVFCTQAGLGISYIDLMTIQAHAFLTAVAEGKEVYPSIEEGYHINVLIDAMLQSDREHRWVSVPRESSRTAPCF